MASQKIISSKTQLWHSNTTTAQNSRQIKQWKTCRKQYLITVFTTRRPPTSLSQTTIAKKVASTNIPGCKISFWTKIVSLKRWSRSSQSTPVTKRELRTSEGLTRRDFPTSIVTCIKARKTSLRANCKAQACSHKAKSSLTLTLSTTPNKTTPNSRVCVQAKWTTQMTNHTQSFKPPQFQQINSSKQSAVMASKSIHWPLLTQMGILRNRLKNLRTMFRVSRSIMMRWRSYSTLDKIAHLLTTRLWSPQFNKS